MSEGYRAAALPPDDAAPIALVEVREVDALSPLRILVGLVVFIAVLAGIVLGLVRVSRFLLDDVPKALLMAFTAIGFWSALRASSRIAGWIKPSGRLASVDLTPRTVRYRDRAGEEHAFANDTVEKVSRSLSVLEVRRDGRVHRLPAMVRLVREEDGGPILTELRLEVTDGKVALWTMGKSGGEQVSLEPDPRPRIATDARAAGEHDPDPDAEAESVEASRRAQRR